ncbi:hypothetical protein Taro_039053, partial [Colocasia esculenta]|nr:hypothetical protein [Colocasia esculenta]
RREEHAEQRGPARQGPVLPPPPPVDYGVFMQGESLCVVGFITAYTIRGRSYGRGLGRVCEALSGQVRPRAYSGHDGVGVPLLDSRLHDRARV